MKFKRRLLAAAIGAALGMPAASALAFEEERPDHVTAPEAEADERIWAPERRPYAEPSAEAVPPALPPEYHPEEEIGGLAIRGNGMEDPEARLYVEPSAEAVPPGPPPGHEPEAEAIGAPIAGNGMTDPAQRLYVEPSAEAVPPGMPAQYEEEQLAHVGATIEEEPLVAEVEPPDEPVARPAPTPVPAEPRDDVARAPEPAPAPAPTPAAPEDQVADEPPVTDELVRDLQQALRERGHDPGPVDGIWGPQTEQALAEFQQEQDMEATGQMDAETVAELDLEEQ